MPPMSPLYIGLFANGTDSAIISIAPENTPAAPSPATARPTISAFAFGAAPHTTEPTSNKLKAAKYTHFTLKKVYNFPKNS